MERVEPKAGELLLVSTNEHNYIDRNRRLPGYAASSLEAAASYLASGPIFRAHEHGVLGLTVKLERGFPALGGSLQVPLG